MDIKELFKVMVESEASDLYLTVGRPPMYRIEGKIQPIGDHAFTPPELETLAKSVMSEAQLREYGENLEFNMAMSLPGVSRFRVNVFRQRGSAGMVIRRVKAEVSTLAELDLPDLLKEIAMSKRGLVLVVGATGSGKSTTLAAMVDHRNATESGHIITIEDPIEFVHRHKKSIVTQREVGFDTHSFQSALKNTLRQAPDVILIGEIRDTETMEAAVTFAETGHLPGNASLQQRQPGNRTDHEFFSARAARADLSPAFLEPQVDYLTAAHSFTGWQAGSSAGDPRGYPEGQGSRQKRGRRYFKGGYGTRSPGRLPNLRSSTLHAL